MLATHAVVLNAAAASQTGVLIMPLAGCCLWNRYHSIQDWLWRNGSLKHSYIPDDHLAGSFHMHVVSRC